ncbi:MAG TPA: hypothetical protein ENO22_05020 [candidate division Zixibacteria bacterium]|nr:hypothetical protein [candidate division Zixibacteria bacterium]HEQ98685.1 hypothetical protein [candidate division Zixibacteria bacterium]
MEYSQVVELEEKLLELLRQEYSFYQSLYLLFDKQRDNLRFERDQKLIDLYNEIEKAERRIAESEDKIARLRSENRKVFNLAATSPEVKKLVTSIATLLKKNLALIKENEDFAKNKRNRIEEELEQVRRMYDHMACNKADNGARVFDGRS